MLRTSTLLILCFYFSAIGFAQSSDDDQPKTATVRVDVNDAIRMAIHPEPVPQRANEYRLLPSDPQLKDGNAAVVMLRMTYEQQAFMNDVVPKMRELVELDHDDPRIAAEFSFGKFYRQLARAAYLRDAQWHYPLNEQPLWGIGLPDAQSMRVFVDRGLKLHCGTLIAQGKLHEARDCLLVQIACARHVARTPILVNRLIAEAACSSAIERAELLIRQPNSPNLYWALAMLPDSIVDTSESLQWEAEGLVRSIPSLGGKFGYPPIGHKDWNGISETFSNLMVREMGKGMSELEAAALQVKLLMVAHKDFQERGKYDKATRDKMLPNELVMRWVLMINDDVHGEVEAAFSQPPPLAIARLQKLEKRVQKLMQETGAPATPFVHSMLGIYFRVHAFDRSVKQLQVVEAIRDHASRTGSLPMKLADMQLPCPKDPLTEKPFQYRVSNTQAFLSLPEIPGVGLGKQDHKTYRLKIASKQPEE